MNPIVDGIIGPVTALIGKFIPDADARQAAQIELAKIADEADQRTNDLLVGQEDANKIEAANPNLFVSGWRPFVGWVCGGGLAYTLIVGPIVGGLFHITMPTVDSSQLYPVLMAMLGIGTLRTVEKMGGVATAQATVPTVAQNIVTRTIGKWFK